MFQCQKPPSACWTISCRSMEPVIMTTVITVISIGIS